jgi:hypothetical protein
MDLDLAATAADDPKKCHTLLSNTGIMSLLRTKDPAYFETAVRVEWQCEHLGTIATEYLETRFPALALRGTHSTLIAQKSSRSGPLGDTSTIYETVCVIESCDSVMLRKAYCDTDAYFKIFALLKGNRALALYPTPKATPMLASRRLSREIPWYPYSGPWIHFLLPSAVSIASLAISRDAYCTFEAFQ